MDQMEASTIPAGAITEYDNDNTGPAIPDYDEDLEEVFHGPGLDEGDYDYEEHWDNYDEEDVMAGQELVTTHGDRRVSPEGLPLPQTASVGVIDSIQEVVRFSWGRLGGRRTGDTSVGIALETTWWASESPVNCARGRTPVPPSG